jgi:hypothetical protein
VSVSMTSTYAIAQDVVSRLETLRDERDPAVLRAIRTVFIAGSFIRGDWLEHCSDLDIGVVFKEGIGHVEETPFGLRYISDADSNDCYQHITGAIAEAVGDREFYSQVPGGVDIMAYPEPPSDTEGEIRHIGPPAFNVFRFDLAVNNRVVYGEPLSIAVPQPPIPYRLLRESLDVGEQRMGQFDDQAVSRRRATYLCWRLILKSQCHFGEPTLEKTRMLPLYLRNVPVFPSKAVGEFIIRQYIGTFLPIVETNFLPIEMLKDFHVELTAVVRKSLRTRAS